MSSKRFSRTKGQMRFFCHVRVDEVTDAMRDDVGNVGNAGNVVKVVERRDELLEMGSRVASLEEEAFGFTENARWLRNK